MLLLIATRRRNLKGASRSPSPDPAGASAAAAAAADALAGAAEGSGNGRSGSGSGGNGGGGGGAAAVARRKGEEGLSSEAIDVACETWLAKRFGLDVSSVHTHSTLYAAVFVCAPSCSVLSLAPKFAMHQFLLQAGALELRQSGSLHTHTHNTHNKQITHTITQTDRFPDPRHAAAHD